MESEDMRLVNLIEYANSKRGAKAYFREDWGCYYFDLQGKQFGLIGNKNDRYVLTVKGIPEENEMLRTMYRDVSAGYYANKKHWNSINLETDELSDNELKRMIDISYQLVFEKLPKKVQSSLNEEHQQNVD
ncbi:MmcQ/YjbR family DNA-binding protein [Lysinibacillus sp. LZ02]|uniref:MmcQ/YjbR family DNA-binding protein n=1 Tax=Lysinibacillus sp. LZ02 TaxID=3420668 RepID=UPI003D3612EA